MAGTRGSRARWLTALFVGMFALTFPVGYAGGLGFAALAALAGLLGAPALRQARPPVLVILPLAALAAWALFSLQWSRAAVDPHSLRGYADLGKLTGVTLVLQLGLYAALVAAAERLSSRGASLALTVLALALAALGLAVGLDAAQGGAAYAWISGRLGQVVRLDIAGRNIANGDFVIALLFWCAAVRLNQLRWQVLSLVMFACVVGSCLILHEARAAVAALALGLGAFLLVRATRAFGVAILAVATTIYWMTAPLVVLTAVHAGLVMKLHAHVQPSRCPDAGPRKAGHLEFLHRQDHGEALAWLGAGRQPHLRGRHLASYPRRRPPAMAGVGRGRRGAGGAVLDRRLEPHRGSRAARSDRRRRRVGHGGGLSDHRRAQFRGLAGVVAGARRDGGRGVRLPGAIAVRRPGRFG